MKNENLYRTDINNCEEIELLIDDYLDGMIELNDKEKMDEHLKSCVECSGYFKDTNALLKQVKSSFRENELSPEKKNELWDKVISGINSNEAISKEKEKSIFSKYKYILSGIAACVLIAAGIYIAKNIKYSDLQISQSSLINLPTYWKVSNVKGTSLIDNSAMSSVDSIKEGQWIQTSDSSKAELIVANMGKVVIGPNSKVIFIKGADGNNRIALVYGSIEADINSNPKTFFVEMPSAVAVDLGGSYNMTIDSTGDGLVYVKSGKVEVQSHDNEAIVPAGNLVMTRKDFGVGTPFNENSSPEFKNALLNLDFGNCGAACVNTILKSAKFSDAISLVSMLPRVDEQYKDEVYTKVANYVSPPSNIPSDSIPFIDEEELNNWIDKIQVEVQKNIDKSIRDMEKSLAKMNEIEKLNFDTLKWMEDFGKNFKFKVPKVPKSEYYEYDEYDEYDDSVYFDKEQFKKDMEEMQKELKENINIDKEGLKEDMEQLKEDLEEMKKNLKDNLNLNNEELKKEMENVKEEIKKAVKEAQESMKMIEVEKIPDTLNSNFKFKVKPKDGFEDKEGIEAPEKPQTPKTPEAPEPNDNDSDK